MNKKTKIILGLLMVMILISIPLITSNNEFIGTDDQAAQTINNIDKNYKTWVNPIFNITDDMESIFFTLQAVLGALVLGVCLGRISNKPSIK